MFFVFVLLRGVNDATGGLQYLLQSPFTYCLLQPRLLNTLAHPVPKSRKKFIVFLPHLHCLMGAKLKQMPPSPAFSDI
jgi:hypothetical protein